MAGFVKQVKPLFLDREGSSQIKVKGVADFVTQIDFKVQEQVKTALYELYPEIQFMGEEKDNSEINFDGSVWILDPVDGTTNLIHDFMHNFQFAFAVPPLLSGSGGGGKRHFLRYPYQS